MIFSLNSFQTWSVALARLTLEKAPTVPVCADVWSQIQCKSGVTLSSRTKDAALAMIKLHAFIGFRKGDLNNGCNKARGGNGGFADCHRVGRRDIFLESWCAWSR